MKPCALEVYSLVAPLTRTQLGGLYVWEHCPVEHCLRRLELEPVEKWLGRRRVVSLALLPLSQL